MHKAYNVLYNLLYITLTFQYWLLSPANEMRRDDICWDLVNESEIKLRGCHGSHGHQEFLYREASFQQFIASVSCSV